MKQSGETGGSVCLSVKQAQKIYKKNRKRIRQIIERKISIYQPLEFDEAHPGFCQWIERDELSALRLLPQSPSIEDIEARIEELIRHYLIEQAYYKLEERCVKGRLKKKLGIYNPNDMKLADVTDFVIERIERNNFKKLKTFKEGSKFTTYLATAVTSLLTDYWRSVGAAQKNVKKTAKTGIATDSKDGFDGQEGEGTVVQEISFGDIFQKESQDPYELAVKKEYLEFFPDVWGELEKKRKLVMKMKYQRGMNTSLIARTLGETRYKTDQFIMETEFLIKKEIMLKLKKKRRQK